jgi:prepilin-type N-terminal cleavage/methylation domain-containing protein
MKSKHTTGFTLVELFVVVVIIAILASVFFKVASVVSEKSAVAITSQRLVAISACLAEYYAEFGQYPEVNRVRYTNWDEGDKPSNWSNIIQEGGLVTIDDGGLLYYFRHVMNGQKWDEFKDDVGLKGWIVRDTISVSGNITYSNKVYTLVDGWDADIQYKCDDPSRCYELYSTGTTSSDDDDDIYAGQKF